MKPSSAACLLVLLVAYLAQAVVGFLPSAPLCTRHVTFLSSDDTNSENGDSLDDRMQVIRSLQASFYNSATDQPVQRLDGATGILHHLPLWRVQWNEVPGRTNVLNVHEGIYTNMFETILHQKPPWYVGHLYLPEGSRNLKSSDPKHQLCSWDALRGHDSTADLEEEAAGTVGTLLRITDYRRMVDGRLLLLVQAVERFVVTKVQQAIPYSIANVQIVPDTEEIEESAWRQLRTEGDVAAARALAVQESFERWHRYEHENTMLPLPMDSDLDPNEVIGSALAKVLPYSPFSSVVQVATLRKESLSPPSSKSVDPEWDTLTVADGAQNTLEERLVQGNILREPLLDPTLRALSMDELERRLWLALNDFLKTTRTPVSPMLLGLLPPRQSWPATFVLERIADAVEEQTELDHKYVRVSKDYPALRRQKRLSYSAAALLEDPEGVTAWRRQLLAVPSTRDRMAFVLQRLQAQFGAFQ